MIAELVFPEKDPYRDDINFMNFPNRRWQVCCRVSDHSYTHFFTFKFRSRMSREQTLVRRVGYSKPIMGILASQDTREVVGLSNNMIDKAYNLSPGLSTLGDDCPGKRQRLRRVWAR